MDTAEVIFFRLHPEQVHKVKEQFDAYVAPGIKLFFVDYVDACQSDQFVADFFSDLGFCEEEVNDLLSYRIWGFYYSDSSAMAN